MAECIEREATIKRIKEVYCVGCNDFCSYGERRER